MTSPDRAIFARIEAAEQKFIAYAMETADLTAVEAEAAMEFLKRCKMGRKPVLYIDPVMGQWEIRHCAFLEPDVLRRAAKQGIR